MSVCRKNMKKGLFFLLGICIMLMMVSAFGGYEFVMKAYKEAVAEKYRFLTYGDAMLII